MECRILRNILWPNEKQYSMSSMYKTTYWRTQERCWYCWCCL